MNSKIEIKEFNKDIKAKIAFDENFTMIVTNLIHEKQFGAEREKKVIYDRFTAMLQGKEIVIGNCKKD